MTTVHDFTLNTIDGEQKRLGDYAGKVLLLVNVASRCGLTPHYEGLEKLHRAHADLVVLGIPCNQFMAQEPGSHAEIKAFCSATYDVTFPLFAKIEVNGAGRDPLYTHLTAATAGPADSGDISWNFEKFVVDRRGSVAARFEPTTTPDDAALRAAIANAIEA